MNFPITRTLNEDEKKISSETFIQEVSKYTKFIFVVAIFALFLFYLLFTYLNAGIKEADMEGAENSIWIIGQIEPASLRFRNALIDFNNGQKTHEDAAHLKLQADIFISRISVIDVHISKEHISLPTDLMATWENIKSYESMMYALSDEDDLEEFSRISLLIEKDVRFIDEIRDFSVHAMQYAVSHTAFHRDRLRSLVHGFFLVSIVLVVFLSIVIWLLIFLFGQSRISKKKEEAARENLEKIYNISWDGILLFDADLNVTMINHTAHDILTIPKDVQFGADMLGLIFEGTGTDVEIMDFLTTIQKIKRLGIEEPEEDLTYQTMSRGKSLDGRSITLEILMTIEMDHSGSPMGILFLRDVTKQLDKEKELVDARDEAIQASAAKSNFFASLSHEMRTPITGVIAAMDALRTKCDLDPEVSRYVTIADRSAKSALDQIGNVLDLSWLNQGSIFQESTVFNLSQVLGDLVEQMRPMADQNSIDFDVELPDFSDACVIGPLRAFMRPVNNFLSNAIKMTSEGTVTLRCAYYKGKVRVEVEDTGPGLEPDQVDTLFEPFAMASRKKDWSKSTGLGLSIAKKAVEGMGGKIGVTSSPGSGCCFWFEVAMKSAREEQLPLCNPKVNPLPVKKRYKILLAEDDETSRTLSAEMLRFHNQDVCVAAHGLEALEMAILEPFDIILMDVNMPVMDGTEATRRIRKSGRSKSARIIGITALGSPEEIDHFKAAGMDMVLPKPLTSRKILSLINSDIKANMKISDILNEETLVSAYVQMAQEGLLLIEKGRSESASPHLDEMKASSHRLKGLCLFLGFSKLASLMAEIEAGVACGDMSAFTKHEGELEMAFTDIISKYCTAG